MEETKWRGFDPWIGKIPWRKAWQPTPVFLPGESHGPMSLVGYKGAKNWPCLMQLSTHVCRNCSYYEDILSMTWVYLCLQFHLFILCIFRIYARRKFRMFTSTKFPAYSWANSGLCPLELPHGDLPRPSLGLRVPLPSLLPFCSFSVYRSGHPTRVVSGLETHSLHSSLLKPSRKWKKNTLAKPPCSTSCHKPALAPAALRMQLMSLPSPPAKPTKAPLMPPNKAQYTFPLPPCPQEHCDLTQLLSLCLGCSARTTHASGSLVNPTWPRVSVYQSHFLQETLPDLVSLLEAWHRGPLKPWLDTNLFSSSLLAPPGRDETGSVLYPAVWPQCPVHRKCPGSVCGWLNWSQQNMYQSQFCATACDGITEMKVKCWLLSRVWLFGTVAHQAPLSMEFSRQEYWSG